MFTLGIATVSWKFLKQMVIAKFTVEFEFITLENCGEKAERLHQFLYDNLVVKAHASNMHTL